MGKFRTSSIDAIVDQQSASTVKKTILPNGLRVLSEQIPHVRSVAIGVWVEVGSRDETEENNGITHFLEHMVFKGTRHRSTRAIAESLESLGGYLNAFTTKESTCFYARVLDEHLPQAIDVLADLIQYPKFNPADIEKEKIVVLEELKNIEDDPDEYIQDVLERHLFGNHPLGFTVAGTAENVRSFTRQQLLDHLQTWYTADRIIVAAAGNVQHEQLLEHVQKRFTLRPRFDGSSRATGSPQPPRDKHTPVSLHTAFSRLSQDDKLVVLRKDVQQAYTVLGRLTEGLRSQQRYSMLVFNTLLGDGMSSRLNQSLRERHGLAYTVFSFLNLMSDIGVFGVYAGTDEKNVERAMELVLKEFEGLRKASVSKKELQRTKSQIKGNTVLGLESMSGRMTRLATEEIYYGEYISLETFLSQIDRVTVDDVHDVAVHILDLARFVQVRILPTHGSANSIQSSQ